MTRDEAISTVKVAIAQADAGGIVDALTALGVLKLDWERITTRTPGQATANMPGPGEWFWSKDGCWAPVKPSYSGGGGGGGGNSSTERKLSPAEALARVQLGPEYGPGHQWQVGFGPMGADRLLRALADAGYEVVERQPSLERRMSTKSKA